MIRKITILSIVSLSTLFGASTEDFFYQKGYENGFNKGYELGIKQAFAEAKNVLQKYKADLRAYEIGKYLISTKKLTYPQVWQEVDNSGLIKLRVTPSKLERELNIDELFTKFAVIPERPASLQETLELSLEEKNSISLSDRDINYNSMPQNVSMQSDLKTLSIKKTATNLEILKRANVVFSDEDEAYNVLFFTDKEKSDFCNQFKICF